MENCYIPIQLNFSDYGDWDINILNIELPLPKELYDHLIMVLKYEGDTQFMTNDNCVLEINATGGYDPEYYMKVINESKKTSSGEFSIPQWLLRKLHNLNILVPLLNPEKQIITNEEKSYDFNYY